MTDDLRERVLARVVVQTVDGPCDCDRCKVAAKDALAVAAMVAEECEKACEPFAKMPHTFASENADIYRGFRDGALACANAIRQRAERLKP